MIGVPPPNATGAAAYEQALGEATRHLALGSGAASAPPIVGFREDAAAGKAAGRERIADVEVRSAIMRGGPDSQTALNLAVLDTPTKSPFQELFDSFLAGDLIDGAHRNVELAKGVHAMLKLSQAIERSPDRWVEQCNMAAQRVWMFCRYTLVNGIVWRALREVSQRAHRAYVGNAVPLTCSTTQRRGGRCNRKHLPVSEGMRAVHAMQQLLAPGMVADITSRGSQCCLYSDWVWPGAPRRVLSCHRLAERSTGDRDSAQEGSRRQHRRRSWSP
eukprot:187688-Amphidinium_carterae.1